MRTLVAAAVACLALAGLSHAEDAKASIKQYQISAQPLAEALRAFADQSDMQLIFSESEVGGAKSAGVDGVLTAKQALGEILRGTDLRFEFTENNVVVVRREKLGTQISGMDGSGASGIRLAQADTQQSGAAEAASSKGSEGPEEIVVTAQRRQERLQDVPISMSVLEGEQLDSTTAKDVTEMLSRVPGVAVEETVLGGTTQVTVRGVGAADSNSLGASPTGYYLDSAPFGFVRSAFVPSPDAYDLDRIEVLRGPQGTLYGANALNGVVRVLTQDANLDQVEFKARGFTSNTKDGGWNYRGDMAVNMPIVEGKFAARAVLGYQNLSGWVDKSIEEDANDAERRTVRLKLNAQPTEQLSIALSAWISRGDYGAPSTGFEDRTSASTIDEPISDDFDVYSLKVGYQFSGVSFTSMTSYIDYANRSILDLARAPQPAFFLIESLFDASTFAQEFALGSTGEGPWRWTAGAIYRDSDEKEIFWLPPLFTTPSGRAPSSESYAVFGELTRVFADGRWDFTAGARYFEDKMQEHELSRFTPFTPDQLEGVEEKFDATTPRLVLTWHPSKQTNVYASYSQGFRSGYVNGATVPLPPVRPDKLTNYELGSKGSYLDGRIALEAALYYIDWQDVQQSIGFLIPNTTSYTQAGVNGDSASGFGVDLGLTARPVDALQLGVNVSWNDLAFDSPVMSGGGNVVIFDEGERLNHSAEYTVGAFADYLFPIGGGGYEGQFSVSANYTSELMQRLLLAGGEPQVADSDTILIARTSLSIQAPQNWTATLYVDNINDEEGAVSKVVQGADPLGDQRMRVRPRTIGMQLEYRFK